MLAPSRLFLLTGFAIVLAVPAAAYQIGSASIAKKSFDLHETFTGVARTCLANMSAPPFECSSYFPEALSRTAQRKAPASNDETYASRWPDDPTRMLDGDPSKIRFGAVLFDECRNALAQGSGVDEVGLLCSSHFGRLQFMHAQSTGEDAGAEHTRRKILAWAMFAYRAATDVQFRGTDYCAAVEEIAEVGLKEALTFSDPSLCEARRRSFLLVFAKEYEGWKVGTLFALHCPNPLQEKVCWERHGDYGDETARMAAVGALLHLVQDSFSQSHVARLPAGAAAAGPRGPFSARVVCRRASVFYNYGEQNVAGPNDRGEIEGDPHGAADVRPVLDSTCLADDREVDDIITASATVLHYIDHPDARQFEDYLRTRVFPG